MKIAGSITQEFNKYQDIGTRIQKIVQEPLLSFCNAHKWIFEDRLKTVQSFAQKLELNIGEINDVYASTIIVSNQLAVIKCIELFKKNQIYKIAFKNQKPADLQTANFRASEFSFSSVRLYCSICDNDNLYNNELTSILFEVQIKTLLEHAWDKAAHNTLYKTNEVSWSKERLFSQAKAMLENVELILSEYDSLSKSTNINKKNKKLDKIINLISLIETIWEDHLDKLPANKKRLAESIDRVLRLSSFNQDDLKKTLVQETDSNRGAHITNLSPYWVCVQSVGISMGWNKFLNTVNLKLKKHKTELVLIPELSIPDNIDLQQYNKITMLSK